MHNEEADHGINREMRGGFIQHTDFYMYYCLGKSTLQNRWDQRGRKTGN